MPMDMEYVRKVGNLRPINVSDCITTRSKWLL